MKLVIESDGTLKGTRIDFSMCADEVPKMIARSRRRKKFKKAQIAPVAPVIDAVWQPSYN